MYEIEISKQIDDLVKQLEDCKIVRFRYITEEHSKLLWNIGEIIVRHPLFSHGEKMDLYETLSKRLSFSTRYLEASVQVYKAFPFNTADEALEEAHKKLPDRVTISQRALIGLIGDSSIFATAAKTTDPLKNAIHVSRKEFVEYAKIAKGARYVFDGENEVYIVDENVIKEKPMSVASKLVAHIEDDKLVIDSEINPSLNPALNPALNLEPSSELAERIDNIENNKDVEIIESNLDNFIAVDLESALGLEEMKKTKGTPIAKKLSKSEPYDLAKWFFEFRDIPAEPTQIDMRNFKILLNFYPINIIQGGIKWRLKHDPEGFWKRKITSASVYRNFGSWMAESSAKVISFLEWIKQNPTYDYKRFEDKFARADSFMIAFTEAKKNSLVYFIDEDYKTYKEAIGIKVRESRNELKENNGKTT